MSRRTELIALLLLFLAAVIRIHALPRLPAGFDDEEIANLRITETVRAAQISVFYSVNTSADVGTSGYMGREALFPILETLASDLFGEGFFSYRIVPLFAGLISVALIYALGRRLFGNFEGLVAGLSLTLGLWPVLLARSVLPQAILLMFVTAALLALARAFHVGQRSDFRAPRTVMFTALGLFTALCAYAHWTGLLMLPLCVLFVLYVWVTRQPISRRMYSYSAFALLVMLIVGIPYLITTLRLPMLSGFAALWFQRPADVGQLLLNTRDLFVSLFGGGALNVLLLIVTVALVAIGIRHLLRHWRSPNAMLVLLALIIGVLPAIWIGRGDFDLTLAFPAAALLIGVGAARAVNSLVSGIRRITYLPNPLRAAPAFVVGTLLLVGLLALLSVEFFGKWVTDPTIQARYHGEYGHLALYLDTLRDTLPTLICTDTLSDGVALPLPDTVLLRMMTHRRTVNLRFSDCNLALVLTNGGQQQRVIFNNAANNAVNNAVPHQLPATLAAWLPATQPVIRVPGTQHIVLTEFNVEQPLADAVGKLTLSQVNWPPDLPGAQDTVQLPVRMGDYIHFEGYSLDANRIYKQGDFIHLVTYWRIDGAQTADLRLFAHVLADPGAEPSLQNDTLDVASAYLQDRDIVIQQNTIQLPYPFPAGTYYLSVGAYHSTSQARIPVYDENNQMRGDRLFLGTISVSG